VGISTYTRKLEGTGGTISVPPSFLVGLQARALNGDFGGTVSWFSKSIPGLAGAAGTTFLPPQQPFVVGDLVITGTPGDTVVAYLNFDD
jgi:hypothetical protein